MCSNKETNRISNWEALNLDSAREKSSEQLELETFRTAKVHLFLETWGVSLQKLLAFQNSLLAFQNLQIVVIILRNCLPLIFSQKCKTSN